MRDLIRLLLPALALVLGACRADPNADAPPASATSEAAPPAVAPSSSLTSAAGETWNASQIDWQPYEAGLARAKAENKPICLIFYTSWCPHCKTYSRVFDDPRVVARARNFVMIRVNADDQSEIARKFTKDGGYIPRTFFLAADGTPDFSIHAARDKFIYFYDERNPASLLAGMDEAERKLRN
jgi:protein-disulfide reductase (glutathione)